MGGEKGAKENDATPPLLPKTVDPVDEYKRKKNQQKLGTNS